MAGRELLMATVFVFVVAVFMLVAGPTITGVSSSINASNASLAGSHSVGFNAPSKIDMVVNVALVLVPTMAVIGFVIWGYASVAKRESYRGRL